MKIVAAPHTQIHTRQSKRSEETKNQECNKVKTRNSFHEKFKSLNAECLGISSLGHKCDAHAQCTYSLLREALINQETYTKKKFTTNRNVRYNEWPSIGANICWLCVCFFFWFSLLPKSAAQF